MIPSNIPSGLSILGLMIELDIPEDREACQQKDRKGIVPSGYETDAGHQGLIDCGRLSAPRAVGSCTHVLLEVVHGLRFR
jgi:hypothetical protein